MPAPHIPLLPPEPFQVPIVPGEFETAAAEFLGTLPDAEAAIDADLLAAGEALEADASGAQSEPCPDPKTRQPCPIRTTTLLDSMDADLAEIAFVPGEILAANLNPVVQDAGALLTDGEPLVGAVESGVGGASPPPEGNGGTSGTGTTGTAGGGGGGGTGGGGSASPDGLIGDGPMRI